jgi:hypothetical protein
MDLLPWTRAGPHKLRSINISPGYAKASEFL